MHANSSSSAPDSGTRREFIKKASTAAAVVASANLFKTPVYGQNQAPSSGRVIGANDRITVGIIGVGYGIGQNHLKGIHGNAGENNTVIAAACDLWNRRRDWAKETASLKDSDICGDHRKLLERNDIDAVLIATHDIWHAGVTIDALEAGKHVYCEKPMTRYLDEAFRVHDMVKKTGKVFQLGTQGCSAEGWHKCADLIKGGKVGQLIWAQANYPRNSVNGEWNYKIDEIVAGTVEPGAASAANIDWEQWLGPVKKRVSFNADHFHRWRKYYPYCAGLLGDLVPHRLIPLMVAAGDVQFPTRVTSIATKNVHPDAMVPGTPERDVPEHVQVLAEFGGGYMFTVTCSTVNSKAPGAEIHTHKATLKISDPGDAVELIPEKDWSEEIDPQSFTGLAHEDPRPHEKNWFDCIRNGKPTNANIDIAVRAQTVISLAEMSHRLNMTCLFDEKTRKIMTGDGKEGGTKEVKPITYGTLELS
jgi:predicted dehydrogenase